MTLDPKKKKKKTTAHMQSICNEASIEINAGI